MPLIDEIETVIKESRLTKRGGLFDVCKIGTCVIKKGWD
jgi:hypothetical protein